MKHVAFLIKPASSLCNLHCQYCFYQDVANKREATSKGIMKQTTMLSLIKKAMAYDEITFAFQGGEPTLATIDYFLTFIDYVNQYKQHQRIHYSIQTNGLLLNNEWFDLFEKNNFLVGISLDGIKIVHEKMRGDNFDLILAHLKEIQKRNISFNILTVVTKDLVEYTKEIYQFYKKEKFQYIQFIPCLPDLKRKKNNEALTPALFYKFYQVLFELWYQDLKKGEYISISLFDDLLMIFRGLYPHTCGMTGDCHLQYIIEANGDVYPCDFYALDEYLLGNICRDSLESITKNKNVQKFLTIDKRTFEGCLECKFKNICHSGCKRMNITYFDEEICGYQKFLSETYQHFYQIGKGLI